MKKLFLIALIMSCVGGITMAAQAHPSKKPATQTTTKTEVKKDSVGSAGATADMGKHHKKKANKKQ